MPYFTREAVQVLKYLVQDANPEDFVSFEQVEHNVDLHGTILSDAISELEEHSFIDVQSRLIRPRAQAWEILGKDVVGFDVCEDAFNLAQTVNDAQGDNERGWIEAHLLEQSLSIPIERLNIAALWLRDEGMLDLLRPFGARPYAFASAHANYKTRNWLQKKSLLPISREKLASHYNLRPLLELGLDAMQPASPDEPGFHMKPPQPIFISYRRDDSAGHAGRLRSDLARRYGDSTVFMDMTIEPGIDFVDTLEHAVASCGVLLAVIGRYWLTLADETTGTRRLQKSDDWVRVEIAAALQRGIRVIPVLVHRAQMPPADDLPDNLKPLARRQAHEITDGRWDYDVGNLVKVIDKVIGFTG